MVRKIPYPNTSNQNTSTSSRWEHLASLQDSALLVNKIHIRPGASKALALAEPKRKKPETKYIVVSSIALNTRDKVGAFLAIVPCVK